MNEMFISNFMTLSTFKQNPPFLLLHTDAFLFLFFQYIFRFSFCIFFFLFALLFKMSFLFL